MDFSALHNYMSALAPVPDSEWKDFAVDLQVSNLVTGQALVSRGDRPERVGFVLSGVTKSSYQTQKGVEYVRYFATEGMLVAPYVAFLQRSAVAEVDIVAIEPTKLITFSYEVYCTFLPRHWAWQQIGRLVAEKFYLFRERCQYELHTLTAKERLEAFMTQFPGLAARISQKDLASYIGVTPESMSRLRAKGKTGGGGGSREE
jgi:CRP-like cAMP-binding protein